MEYRVKVSGLLINSNKELLLFRSKDKSVWICPGGKIEEGESDEECLKRELDEEAFIKVVDYKFLLETPVEPAAGRENKFIKMRFYLVKNYIGEPKINPLDNVEEYRWISKDEFLHNLELKASGLPHLEIGSGLELYAIPKLIELDLM